LIKAFLDMNRLVIIGNGFDLAHGLPTKYSDFIDDFWKNFRDKCKSEEYQKLILTNDAYNGYYLGYKEIENFNDLKSNLSEYCLEYSYKFSEVDLIALVKAESKVFKIFQFKNYFFKIINVKNSQNWVDIENEYYRELKKIVKLPSVSIEEKKLRTIVLNKEFEQVKNLLENYLSQKVNVQSAFEKDISNVNEILSFFKIHFKYLNATSEDKTTIEYIKEFNNDDLDDLESFDFKIIEASKKGSLNEDLKTGIIEQNNLFLNFNYTSTINNYIELLNNGDYCGKVEQVQIHGKLYDYKNKINFGFGDEMDDDYKLIENVDDNEYLKNFKSFGYSQNSNYRKLLDFIDGNKFQVYIMGHSCGLSDRTLLNTIFEHQNCRSIKVFYYQWEDVKTNEIKDDYTEIIQNISRHFEDKKMMRSKIVNKISSDFLPQKINK
jgi:hypothetical protein